MVIVPAAGAEYVNVSLDDPKIGVSYVPDPSAFSTTVATSGGGVDDCDVCGYVSVSVYVPFAATVRAEVDPSGLGDFDRLRGVVRPRGESGFRKDVEQSVTCGHVR